MISPYKIKKKNNNIYHYESDLGLIIINRRVLITFTMEIVFKSPTELNRQFHLSMANAN